MTPPLSRPIRRALRTLATTAVAAAVLLPTAAHAAVPVPPVRLPGSIEGFATYQKQTTCSPTAKPGTVKLKNLLLKTYPGTRSLGISRACSAGGTSEHKEGRAFDWGVRVSSASEKAKAAAFLAWLLKTDAAGHKAANARRLGVMYVIWNKRIWGAYAANSGWRAYNGSNPHTDHVHISLSRAGGAGTTSFWTGRINGTSTTPVSGTADSAGNIKPPATSIVPAPRPSATIPAGPALEDESLTVYPKITGVSTRNALVKGQHYRVEVRGTWHWNRTSGSLADAECSATARSEWQATRTLAPAAGDQLGLYLDGHDLALRSYSDGPCASSSHTYVVDLVASRSGKVPLKIWEPATATGYGDNSGSLRVRIIHDAPRDALRVTLDTHQMWGTTTPGSVVAGQEYTITTSGTWTASGLTADAVCVDRSWGQDQDRSWRLQVDGKSLQADCDGDHAYTWQYRAERTGPLVVRIEDDDSYDDNAGHFAVSLTRSA
ncbi:MAG TPA: hypothetical protein VMZ11_04720 [Mycobacteriales bacterium]|nr:hypothetical protein [Mycobacteriales bacterium]